MLFINLTSTDPHSNLATEEYLLKNLSGDIVMLWQNDTSVIVGKHQNMLAEVNYPYVMQHGIPLVRRLSGGGAVLHDSGNINFTYIYNGTAGTQVNFGYFMQPIVDFLCGLGLRAVRSLNNDILIDGLKVSGNAEHVYKNRVLHHGTLLFSSDLDRLSAALRPSGAMYNGKAVKSKRVPVANIQQYLPEKYSAAIFRSDLAEYILQWFQCESYELNRSDISNIEQIAKGKIATWDWNFGYSPDYAFRSNAEPWELRLDVHRGLIERAVFSPNKEKDDSIIIRNLNGVAHDNFKAVWQIIESECQCISKNSYKMESVLY